VKNQIIIIIDKIILPLFGLPY